MKKEIARISVGMDIGKDDVHVCVKYQDRSTAVSIKSTRKFKNTIKGLSAIHEYLSKYSLQENTHVVVLEATGVYYENLAYFLEGLGYKVVVILPKYSAYFAKTLKQKSKNDKKDSIMLAQLGIEKFGSLEKWVPPSKAMRQLRQLVRYRSQLIKHNTRSLNQLHAVNHSYKPDPIVLEGLERQIEFHEKEIALLDVQINACIKEDDDIFERIEKVCTIQGIGMITAAILVGETLGFAMFKSIPQLVSYAGYDVVENQSGNRSGKTRISKKGNARIRAALLFPSFVAVQRTPRFADNFHNIYARNPKHKMIGYVAIQRKLLVLAYILYTRNVPYDPNYEKKKNMRYKKVGKVAPTYAV